ncbi:amidoligase family protein [Cohnella soli]|uniref:Amidoligase family protein n=1 Tax=Cohnella soli TaxID=425005 RepID=A0ABW0HMM6_9BACL
MPAETQPRFSNCRICNRKLTNARSVSVSMGPVCARRFGAIFEEALAYARTIGRQLDTGTLENQMILASQQAYRERISRSRRGAAPVDAVPPVPEDRTVQMWSATRGREEQMRVEFSDAHRARITSESGHTYDVTDTSCSCPHHRNRLQGTEQTCRHIDALRLARGRTQEPAPAAAAETDRVEPVIIQAVDRALHERVTQRFADINWVEEEAREGVLNVWRENRAFDGVYMSEDDEAWQQLQEQAQGDWEYQYENVLGGTGNSFGMEIEFELPRNVSYDHVAQALYRADIIDRPNYFGYHGGDGRVGPGYFRLETDGSLSHGLELVSPVMFDNRESWEKIEKATQILRDLGARTNDNTGGHIHVGIAPLDHRTYSWQRLARIGLAYEHNIYRMGGADADTFARNGTRGEHRGSGYAAPFPSSVKQITSTSSAESARAAFGQRYTIFNTTNVDASRNRKPTVEMRYPNSTLNPKQWQAQIQVANAIVHQAAVIRNESPQARFTPGLLQTHNQLRVSDRCNDQMETDQFRKFLDVLGNAQDRLAATWLFTRGRA